MKRAALILLLCAGAAHGQMYKWKDANGKTHFSDSPPPANAVKAEMKSYRTGGTGGGDLPGELGELARAKPVVLYTTSNCTACDQGRTQLLNRGIPFREKTVSSVEDHEAVKRAGSDGQFPLLLIGRSKQVGYESSTWDGLLTNAGYPTTKSLPAGYQNPPATPAAPPRQPSAAEQAAAAARQAAAEAARMKREKSADTPPDFQF